MIKFFGTKTNAKLSKLKLDAINEKIVQLTNGPKKRDLLFDATNELSPREIRERRKIERTVTRLEKQASRERQIIFQEENSKMR